MTTKSNERVITGVTEEVAGALTATVTGDVIGEFNEGPVVTSRSDEAYNFVYLDSKETNGLVLRIGVNEHIKPNTYILGKTDQVHVVLDTGPTFAVVAGGGLLQLQRNENGIVAGRFSGKIIRHDLKVEVVCQNFEFKKLRS